ncbi:MAG: DUF1634 domain-containing protein [Parachlamydiaceae bacterium]
MDKTNKEKHASLEVILSRILQTGLVMALLVTITGGVLLLWEEGSIQVNYKIFIGEPVGLTHIPAIILGAFNGYSRSIIQLGILLMIVTPIVRVLSCAILFACQRDLLYVVLSGFVFVVLVSALIW